MHIHKIGLLWWLSGKESASQCRRCGFVPLIGKILWRRKWQHTPVVAQMVKVSTCNAGDPGSIPGSGRLLGKGNGYHSCTLAWKIPRMEESGKLQSMGQQRLGHDFTFAFQYSGLGNPQTEQSGRLQSVGVTKESDMTQ